MVAGSKYSCCTNAVSWVDIATRLIRFIFLNNCPNIIWLGRNIYWKGITLHFKMQTGVFLFNSLMQITLTNSHEKYRYTFACLYSLSRHFMKSGWVKLNKLAISVQKIDGQFCIPLASPIHPLFRVKGSGVTMFLFIISFVLYSALIHLSLCSN